MRGFVAVTDNDWFDYLRSISPPVEEVNFWRPSEEASFRALQPGEPIFFKLKSPRNAIGGFGYFVHYTSLPISVAWETYGEKNGARSYPQLHETIRRLRSDGRSLTPRSQFPIGCILLNFVEFFDEPEWIRVPDDFSPSIQVGKGYDLNSGQGRRIWDECQTRASRRVDSVADRSDVAVGGYGEPVLVRPRLGQHSFRVVVLDKYFRRCAVTNEKTVPTLEAAHIRSFADQPEHLITNGVLLRADLHRLLDSGYATITTDFHFLTSRRVKEDFDNGAEYYRLSGSPIRRPENPNDHPAREFLTWHNDNKFLG